MYSYAVMFTCAQSRRRQNAQTPTHLMEEKRGEAEAEAGENGLERQAGGQDSQLHQAQDSAPSEYSRSSALATQNTNVTQNR